MRILLGEKNLSAARPVLVFLHFDPSNFVKINPKNLIFCMNTSLRNSQGVLRSKKLNKIFFFKVAGSSQGAVFLSTLQVVRPYDTGKWLQDTWHRRRTTYCEWKTCVDTGSRTEDTGSRTGEMGSHRTEEAPPAPVHLCSPP